MSTVEATKVTSSALAPVNRGEASPRAARPLHDFASLLASTRQSSKVLGDLVGQRNAEAASARRQERAARSLERARSEESDRSRSRRREDGEPGLVESTDRMDSESDRVDEQPIDRTEEARCAEGKSTTAGDGDAAWAGEQASVPAACSESQPPSSGIRASAADASLGPATPPAGPDSCVTTTAATGAPAASQPVPAGQVNSVATNQAAAAGAVPQVGAATAANAAGSGAGGASIETASTATARGAEGAGRSAGSSTDFQNLLDQLGRQRGNATRAQVQPGTLAGKADAKGINLAETTSVHELSRVLRSQINTRHSTMTLQLTPAELGRVRVNVEMHNQVVSVRFQAETAAGEEALRSRLNDLRGSLEQQGIRIDRIDVETRPPMQGDPARESQQDPRQGMAQWDGSASGGNAQQENMPRTSGGASSMPAAVHTEDLSGELPRIETLDVTRPAESGVDLVA